MYYTKQTSKTESHSNHWLFLCHAKVKKANLEAFCETLFPSAS